MSLLSKNQIPQSTLATIMIKALAAAALVFVSSAMALEDKHFEFQTTGDLARVCGVSDGAPGALPAVFACRAFIAATMQYHDAIADYKQLKPLTCPPRGTTIADGRATFLAWANTNANDVKLMGEVPVVGLVRALAAKYPCQ